LSSEKRWETLRERVTPERLAPYEAAMKPGMIQDAFRLYAWDVELASACLEEIHYFEVIFRNALAKQLQAKHGSGSGHWYDHLDWFNGTERDALADVLTRVANQNERDRERGRPTRLITPNWVVSDLNFGFWRWLVDAQYSRIFWDPTPGFHLAFPNLEEARDRRGYVHAHATQINKLRNDIAHHQSLLNRNVLSDHQAMVDVLGWICADSAWMIEKVGKIKKLVTIRPRPKVIDVTEVEQVRRAAST